MKVVVPILIAILLTVLLYKELIQKGETFESDVGNIGNTLTDYIQELGAAWARGETFEWGDRFEGRFFYENLPTRLEKPPGKEFTLPKGYRDWIIDTDEKKKFYEDLKPYVHDILDQALKKTKDVNTAHGKAPVIHFRCSDAPFSCSTGKGTDHCFDYHFQKYEFYKKALTGQKEAEILTCNKHNSNDDMKKACIEYSQLLKQELESTGITVQLRMCEGDALEDFAKMFYAPLVVSIGSSMSFMAGFYGHGKFVTSGHIVENEDGTVENTCRICEYGQDMNLLHRDSGKNYYDVQSVHQKLKS